MPNFGKTLEVSKSPDFEKYFVNYAFLQKKIKSVNSKCAHVVHENLSVLDEL